MPATRALESSAAVGPVPVWIAIPAAGSGARMGAALPKQYLPLAGRVLAEHTLDTLLAVPGAREVVVALAPADAHWQRLPAALRERVRYVHAHYQQPALVERFLTGAEFTVGVLGAGDDTYALGAAEVKAAAAGGIYGYQEKQPDRDGAELYAPVRDENLRTQLCDLGVRAFRILGARDAGRVDIRLDEDGQPQLLEINPLAGMHPNFSALPTMAHWAGLSYNSLVSIMLNHARRRWLTT